MLLETAVTNMTKQRMCRKKFDFKGLIAWVGLLRCAEMTFSPALHEASQPGWWLMQWTARDRSELDFGAKKARAARYFIAGSLSFQNGHHKNAANDCNCQFSSSRLYYLFHLCSFIDFYICFCSITRCTLAGSMTRADPADAITWKNLIPASREPGTAIPGSRLKGPARLLCEAEFCCV